ncbi:MAG: 3-hydroxybutyryl-CoA dehydrogenase [Alphaproteobacteria bacterium]
MTTLQRPRIAALGAGRMGRGLAHVFAYAGHEVALIDLKPRDRSIADEARHEIASNLSKLAYLGVFEAQRIDDMLARITFVEAADAEAALAGADVVFEGVPETAEAKRPALELMGRAAKADAILASTTSTMLVDELAAFAGRPDRFLNAHWLNPAYLIPLVEVSPGAATDPAVTEAMTALLTSAGKQPVVCAARPGFIVPRIQALAMNEAARMVEEGVAAPAEIDRAIRYGFGVRYAVMGLIEFIDWGGGDILYHASNYLTGALGSDRYAAPDIVNRNMAEGNIGLKSGQGFYDFRDLDLDAHQRETLRKFVDLLRHLDLLPPPADTAP